MMRRIFLAAVLNVHIAAAWTFVAGFSVLSLQGCTTAQKNTDNEAEIMFDKAVEFEGDERYEEAIQRFTDVKNKFPYSRFATDSELHIADIQFKRENYIEAQGAYQIFKELHPRHPQVDFVTYRLALSYFNQLPSTIDRDLTVATKALQYLDEVLSTYSASSYAADAKEKKSAVLKMLAEKEIYIADFYFKHENYDSALVRYEKVFGKYADQGFNPKALLKGAISAFESGERETGEKLIGRLEAEYSQSLEARDVSSVRSKYGVH